MDEDHDLLSWLNSKANVAADVIKEAITKAAFNDDDKFPETFLTLRWLDR